MSSLYEANEDCSSRTSFTPLFNLNALAVYTTLVSEVQLAEGAVHGMTGAKDVTESAFVFIHTSLHQPPRDRDVSGYVMAVTSAFSRMCDNQVVNMVWKVSKKAFLEPGDTR